MTLTLDPQTERVIQSEIDLGHAHNAAEVIAYAVELLQGEQDWFTRNQQAINARLGKSLAEEERGETYSPEEARRVLAERRAIRAA